MNGQMPKQQINGNIFTTVAALQPAPWTPSWCLWKVSQDQGGSRAGDGQPQLCPVCEGRGGWVRGWHLTPHLSAVAVFSLWVGLGATETGTPKAGGLSGQNVACAVLACAGGRSNRPQSLNVGRPEDHELKQCQVMKSSYWWGFKTQFPSDDTGFTPTPMLHGWPPWGARP